MKKILALMLCILFTTTIPVSANELSEWAEDGFDAANTAGLLSQSIVSNDLKGNVTRAEFCDIVMNMYKSMSDDEVELLKNPFEDTDSKAIISAYSLGIIGGKSDTEFCPDDEITRQEMTRILIQALTKAGKDTQISADELEKMSEFEDFYEVDDWAAADMARAVKYGLIAGVNKNTIAPHGFASREQAIAVLTRAFNTFSDEMVYYPCPEIQNLYDGVSVTESIDINWTEASGANKYILIIKDEKHNCVESKTVSKRSVTINTTGLDFNKNYTVIVGAVLGDGKTVFSRPVEIFYGTEQEVLSVDAPLADRYKRVFPDGVPFATEEDAAYNMVSVSFPVWKMKASGEKYSSTASITVNRNLADEVVAIFTDIYNDPEKFPIKDVGCYSWRNTAMGKVSQHSYGTCIDINYNENYYCYASTGDAITGKYWKPGEDPYSITNDGSVVRAFARYGWAWGGNAWSTLRDYMHFSYLGN